MTQSLPSCLKGVSLFVASFSLQVFSILLSFVFSIYTPLLGSHIPVAQLTCIASYFVCCAASGPATPDSAENVTQHLSPESSRKAYCRTWDGSSGIKHVPQSPNVFSEHSAGSNMSPSSVGHLKSPAPGRTRSVSDSSAPRRGPNLARHTRASE